MANKIDGYSNLKPFRFWCQKVLPLVYDESLSYYELLCKVVEYLNNTMEDVNTLANFVEHYFDNLNVSEEVNDALDQMASDGTLQAIIERAIPETVQPFVTSWMDEHIEPTTPPIDDTLTIEGAGADAKVTGDKIARLEWSVAPVFQTNQNYYAGDYVIYNDWLWKFKVNHSAGAWDESQVDFKRVMSEIKDMNAGATMIADNYDPTASYDYGDYAINNNYLWKHKTNSTGWDSVKVMNEMAEKETMIADRFSENGSYNYGDCVVDQNKLWRKVIGGWNQIQVMDEIDGIYDRISNEIKWIAIGDSITQGVYSEFEDNVAVQYADRSKSFCATIASMNGYALNNQGLGGAGWLTQGVTIEKNLRQFIDTKTDGVNYDIDFTQYDLCTIEAGVNDWRWGMTFGTFNDNVQTGGTCYSNMRYIIEDILTRNPNIRIVVISPINTYSVLSGTPTKANNWGIGFEVNGKTLEDMFDLEQTVCEYYGIEFIDMLHTSVVNRENIETALPDKLHPSEYIHKQLGRQLAKLI